jgi:hypothetical protein
MDTRGATMLDSLAAMARWCPSGCLRLLAVASALQAVSAEAAGPPPQPKIAFVGGGEWKVVTSSPVFRTRVVIEEQQGVDAGMVTARLTDPLDSEGRPVEGGDAPSGDAGHRSPLRCSLAGSDCSTAVRLPALGSLSVDVSGNVDRAGTFTTALSVTGGGQRIDLRLTITREWSPPPIDVDVPEAVAGGTFGIRVPIRLADRGGSSVDVALEAAPATRLVGTGTESDPSDGGLFSGVVTGAARACEDAGSGRILLAPFGEASTKVSVDGVSGAGEYESEVVATVCGRAPIR